jgi:hypothetical protein
VFVSDGNSKSFGAGGGTSPMSPESGLYYLLYTSIYARDMTVCESAVPGKEPESCGRADVERKHPSFESRYPASALKSL